LEAIKLKGSEKDSQNGLWSSMHEGDNLSFDNNYVI